MRKILYTIAPKYGQKELFKSLQLPNGTLVKMVKREVHEEALKAATKAFKKIKSGE